MVLYFENKHQFKFDFETTSLAYFNRYPNPYAKHVLSIDTIESYIDNQGQLCTTRLIVKTGRLPNFIKPILGNSLNSWIIEKTIINRHDKTLISYTSNLDHRKFIRVEEYLKYSGHQEDNDNGDDNGRGLTNLESKVKFSSNLFGFKQKIEQWSHQKFSTNIKNSREGLQYVMMKLKQRSNGLLLQERKLKPKPPSQCD
ncbi:hypothetical protein MGE_06260 [Candida albicans P75010]|nr:hypothetical protein MGE_06260 [Candida albicans P75010]